MQISVLVINFPLIFPGELALGPFWTAKINLGPDWTLRLIALDGDPWIQLNVNFCKWYQKIKEVSEIGSTEDILFVHCNYQSQSTLYNMCSAPWGVFSTVGGIMMHVSWVPWGMFSTVGDIMINVGISWVPWGILSTRVSTVGRYHGARGGDIMSTMGVVQYRGGYHPL